MTKVFIIILNWKQPKLTIETVESVNKMKVPKDVDVKIVIVDNGSVDDSVEQFRKMKSGKFSMEIMEVGRNLGFAGGNNLGMKYAVDKNADYILVMNNDIEVDTQMLAQMLTIIKEDKKIAMVSPKMYFAEGYEYHKDKYTKKQLGKVIWYAGGKIDYKNVYGKNIGVDEVDKGQYNKKHEIDFATGAAVLINSEALKEVGYFNEKYFMYMEDVDLSERIRRKNWKIVYNPKAVLWHKISQSSGIGSDLNDYFISRNRLMFGFKYTNLRTKFALVRESIKIFIFGRHWQALGVRDFYLKRFGKGSWGR